MGKRKTNNCAQTWVGTELQHTAPQTHPGSDQLLQTSVTLCVWPGRSQPTWQRGRHHHLKALTFYWQNAFLEHIDSLNREHQPNNLLKAIVCFLGLAKHLVHVIQPCKTKFLTYFFEEKFPQPAQMMMNLWFPMAATAWCVHCTLHHVLPSERYLFHLWWIVIFKFYSIFNLQDDSFKEQRNYILVMIWILVYTFQSLASLHYTLLPVSKHPSGRIPQGEPCPLGWCRCLQSPGFGAQSTRDTPLSERLMLLSCAQQECPGTRITDNDALLDQITLFSYLLSHREEN